MLDHEVLELIVIHESEEDGEEEEKALSQPADVTDPVKYAVHVTIYAIQVQMELICHLQVHTVRKLVWTDQLESIAENLTIIFSQCAELIVVVLEAQIGQLDLVDDLFAHLRIYWDPDGS